ncbi:MAG: response regulator [Terriglobia bacterium]
MNILHLEDSDEDAELIREKLLKEGITGEVTRVETRPQFVAALDHGGWDLILADYSLPTFDGLAAVRLALVRRPRVPFIFVTGSLGEDVAVETVKAGATDYVLKHKLGRLAPAVKRAMHEVELGRRQRHAEHELRVNNEKLKEQTRRAEEASLAKSNFLAAMSHEIRTPMNAILGMSDMLAETSLDPEQRQYVEVFRRAGANLLILINDILDLSKIEAGHLELEHVDFDLEEVVDQAIEITGVRTRAKGIVLLSRLSPGLTTALVGDPGRLRQVLINLLGNAVKFTEAGEVMLAVENHPSGRPGEIEFAISDTGIGIPADMLEAVFDSFTQGDASTTRKYGGTGLGLKISRQLVQYMGGTLTATSEVGKGSTFRFNVKFAPGLLRERPISNDARNFVGCRVLIVDANPTNRFITRETLSAWGMESHDFGDPLLAEAHLSSAIASQQPYALAMVDRDLPGMDGFEAAARMTRIAPDLPIIMFTSDPRPGDIRRRRNAGLSGFAVKPVKRSDLLHLLCNALKHTDSALSGACPATGKPRTVPGKSLKILIADDSEDNRLLLQVYLKGTPHQLTFAEHGVAAVERFSTESFDLVLMDIQMPLMDGLAATVAIRDIERERQAQPTPIVAITANALSLDRELSHKAGCNYHLSKPISKHKLLAAIEDWVPDSRAALAPAGGTAPAIQVQVLPGLEDIVPGYLEARRAELPEMAHLLAASAFDRLARLSHNIKGTGGSYGFPELTRLGAALEMSAKRPDPGALSLHLNELKDYLGQIQLLTKS